MNSNPLTAPPQPDALNGKEELNPEQETGGKFDTKYITLRCF